MSSFVDRWGWRAYAIPLLTVATVVTLLDMTSQGAAQDRPTARVAGSSTTQTSQSTGTQSTGTQSTGTQSTTAPAATSGAPLPVGPVVAAGTYVQHGAGSLAVVPGGSAVLGSGPLLRFRVEVEDGIGMDAQAFAAAVEQTLGDPRSWGAGGRKSFQRVDTADYDFSVALVSPDSVESFCPGYGTNGYTSCRYRSRAVVNLARWQTAVPDYPAELTAYRQYVVNHEVGHYLGHGHVPCPGPGQLSPVMAQQTLGLDGCLPNAWPFPEGG